MAKPEKYKAESVFFSTLVGSRLEIVFLSEQAYTLSQVPNFISSTFFHKGSNRTSAIRGQKLLTNLSVEDLFLSIANWFNDLEERLEESEIT